MTEVFLQSSTQQGPATGFVSDEIVSPPNGSIIIQVNGVMETAERWVIEQAMVGSNDWEAVHRTDSSSSIAEWQGVRDLNRVFVFAVSDDCRYRLRKVASDTTAEVRYNRAITGGTFTPKAPSTAAVNDRSEGLTAFWAQWQTRLSL